MAKKKSRMATPSIQENEKPMLSDALDSDILMKLKAAKKRNDCKNRGGRNETSRTASP